MREIHHAHLLVGEPDEAELYVRSLSKELGIVLTNNPDFFTLKLDTFGIDEARQLRLLATRKATDPSSRKIFFISSLRLTLGGQNALLKTFEEPSLGTLFFVSVREEGLIIPTLLSRVKITRLVGGDISSSTHASEFVSLPLKKRLLFAKKFADDKKHLSAFLDELLVFLKKKNETESLKKVYEIRRFANDPASSSRLILEHLSLVI